MRALRIALACCLCSLCSSPLFGWHPRLSYHGGGYWRTRAVVEVKGSIARSTTGEIITLVVGTGVPDLPLAGTNATALRVCDEWGRELKYDLRTASGAPRRRGRLQAGDRLLFAVDVPAGQVGRYFVYTDNPRAWPVVEFLRTGLANGSFEEGESNPSSWERVHADAHYQLAWVRGVAHTGERSVRTTVRAGATPAWVTFRQAAIPVVPGRRYRFRGYVKAKNVRGRAGWFVHVLGDRGGFLLNRVLSAGEGTYDWRRVELNFVAPEGAREVRVGTVLYGTGTAWFDDAALEAVDGNGATLRVRVVKVERRELRPLGEASDWPDDPAWTWRVPLTVYHFGNERVRALVYVDLRKVQWRFSALKGAPGMLVIDPSAPADHRMCPHLRHGWGILFLASLPPRSAKRFDLYLSPTADSPGEMGYEELLRSDTNLVPNPSLEEGDILPTLWRTTPNRANSQEGFRVRRAPGGRWGRWALKLEVSPSLRARWTGLQLTVPAKPQQTYFFSGFIKVEGNAVARLHGHWLDARRHHTRASAFFSTTPAVSAGEGWVRTTALVASPPDTAFVRLHLTTNTPGTFWYDGLFLGEVYPAVVGEWEQRAASQAQGWHVWPVNPLVKVFPDTFPEDPPSSLDVLMTKNEWEPVQLALRSDRPLRQVRVEVSPLRNEEGDALPSPQLWRVRYVRVDHPSAYYRAQLPEWYRLTPRGPGQSDGWAGEWPDPLTPLRPFDLSARRTEAVLLLLRTEPDTKAGAYTGHVRVVVEDQELLLPVRVRVVPLTLPRETELKVIFDLRPGRGWNLFTDRKRLRTWYRFLARYRISPGFVYPAPTFHYRNGQVRMDAEQFDETADYLLGELGVPVLYTPQFLYAFGWAYRPKRYFGLEPFTPEYNRAYQALLRTFFQHVQEKRWGDRFVYYISDEPHFRHGYVREQMKRLCDLAHDAAPGIKIYSSVWNWVPEWEGHLDIWGIGPHGSCPVPEMRRLRQRGYQLWFTTDGHMCIDTPYLAIERLLPYLCFKYGVAGYEFWGVSWWTYNPWRYGWHAYIRQSNEGKHHFWVRYPNGDGYLTYPGEELGQEEPLPSIRLIQVREGIEDYLLFRALERALREGQWTGERANAVRKALDQIRNLVRIPNQGGLRSTALMPDPDLVIEARRRCLEAAFGADHH